MKRSTEIESVKWWPEPMNGNDTERRSQPDPKRRPFQTSYWNSAYYNHQHPLEGRSAPPPPLGGLAFERGRDACHLT